MRSVEAEKELSSGLKALREGRPQAALFHFEKAAKEGADPVCSSYLGYCIARERGLVKAGLKLCREAIEADPGNSILHLNLGRVHLLAGDKPAALAVFREGMSRESNSEIGRELDKIGERKPPPVPFLERRHPLNKYLGIILRKLGVR